MDDVWEPVPGTRYFTRNGKGLYERLTPQMYFRVDELEAADAVECFGQFSAPDVIVQRAMGSLRP
ncbi:MAG: hypothetical protein J0H67_20120 [Rhodospirillales bacterium]|nr:hypothetical protein [Rhodospirillales bacterium]